MKLPATIRIGPYRCKVTRHRPEYDAEGFAAWGTFDTDTFEIEIAESDCFNDETLIASTVLHEMIHGINMIYGLPDDEATVRKLETALAQILKDNKTLFRTILKALK
jgi:hypothetical protein